MDGVTVPGIDASVVPLDQVRTTADFCGCLEQLRMLAGPLSHREIAHRSDGALRRTKVGQVLAGELPRRDFLIAYLQVCGVSEDAFDSWLQVWTRLVSAGRLADDERVVLRRQRDAANDAVRGLTDELEALRAELRYAQAEYAAAAQRTSTAGELDEFVETRLRTAGAVRDEAVARARVLANELDAARARIAELTRLVDQLRKNEEADRKRLAAAKNDNVQLREKLVRRSRSDPKRLTVYSPDEAEELFGSDETTAPPSIGDNGV